MALNGDKTMPSARRPNDRALTSGLYRSPSWSFSRGLSNKLTPDPRATRFGQLLRLSNRSHHLWFCYQGHFSTRSEPPTRSPGRWLLLTHARRPGLSDLLPPPRDTLF